MATGSGKDLPSPRRKGSLFLGPEPSYSLVLHFAVNFNSGELALRVLGLRFGVGAGLVSCSPSSSEEMARLSL